MYLSTKFGIKQVLSNMADNVLLFDDILFQGVLDMLANRCLAQGTNAWTDTDHTCYTVMTAGSQGFLNLLPIYLDHVLYPTLTVCIHVYIIIK